VIAAAITNPGISAWDGGPQYEVLRSAPFSTLNGGQKEEVMHLSALFLRRNGRHDWIRTNDLFRVKVCCNL
jgi:hypothetical protein